MTRHIISILSVLLFSALVMAAGCMQPGTGQLPPSGQETQTPTPLGSAPGVNLTITGLTCEMDEKNDVVVVTGHVANDGTVTARVVEVHVSLFNGTQAVKTTTSFVQNTDIPAGGSDSFQAIIVHPTNWTRCEANTTYNVYLSR